MRYLDLSRGMNRSWYSSLSERIAVPAALNSASGNIKALIFCR